MYTSKLIAHRGYYDLKKGIPENSLESFKRAIIFNYNIELDVVMLKDNNIVIFHDKNLKRACNIDIDIEELTYEQIKDLKIFNTKSKIPLLKEVLDLNLSDTTLFIDVKYNVDQKELAKILDKYSINYVIISFFSKKLIWFKQNRSNIKRGVFIINFKFKYLFKMLYKFYKPDFLLCNINMCERNMINRYRKKYIIIGWTVKTKEDYYKYKNSYDNLICENMNNF